MIDINAMKKIPVIIWMYHTNLWNEFLELLIKNKNYVYPVVGLHKDHDNKIIIKSIKENFDEFDIDYYDNYGKDIGPFLFQIQKIESPFFIKIHSKKCNYWRRLLVNDLLGDVLLSNIKTLSSDVENNDIGLIANGMFTTSNNEYTNKENIKQICNIINIDYEKIKNGRFLCGTMFMSRTDIFKKYFNCDTTPEIIKLIKNETGDVKDKAFGTFTHALERIFGYIITNEGMRITSPN
jgi:lipopolysaccharide biosynthesis protein